MRRGQSTTTGIVAATFTTDGTLNAPIKVTADYDNLWSDFATSSQTVTPVFGATTMTLSASSTIGTGKWIYFMGDCYENASSSVGQQSINPCEFAYEVASSTAGSANTLLTLYLPYKGNQTAAGTEVRVMPANPIVGSLAEASGIFTISSDDYWYIKGLDLRSTAATCVISEGQTRGVLFYDIILQGDGVTDCSIDTANGLSVLLQKTRMFGQLSFIGNSPSSIVMTDFYVNCNSVASSFFSSNGNVSNLYYLTNGEVVGCTNNFVQSNTNTNYIFSRNLINNNTPSGLTGASQARYYFEDNFGVVGRNSQSSNQISTNALSTTTLATTTNLRSGGGAKNQVIFPPTGTGNTGLSTKNLPFSAIKLFEYPIYADTSSKTYTMYFNSTNTAQFITDPLTQTAVGSTTPELWIECEYYNDSSDADRILKRSNTANDVDFNGSTDWQDISVTCQPTQAGINYVRGWYAKPSDGYNAFYMDTTIQIQ